MALDRSFDDDRVQTANVTVSVSTVGSAIRRFNLHAQGKTTFISMTDETAETGVSDQRGRRKTAELHTRGSKRVKTWRGGVKW